MVKIIPCLDIRDGKVVKGVNFENIREVGEILDLLNAYNQGGADEIVVLDISATGENRRTRTSYLKEDLKIPIVIGGGVGSVEDASWLIGQGAAKVSVGSAAVKDPALVGHMVQELGADKLIVAIDSAWEKGLGQYMVYIGGGRVETGLELVSWAKDLEEMGVEEILLTSKDKDGTQSGYDLAMYEKLSEETNLKIIASGGAGSIDDFVQAAKIKNISGLLAASLFHMGILTIKDVKEAIGG